MSRWDYICTAGILVVTPLFHLNCSPTQFYLHYSQHTLRCSCLQLYCTYNIQPATTLTAFPPLFFKEVFILLQAFTAGEQPSWCPTWALCQLADFVRSMMMLVPVESRGKLRRKINTTSAGTQNKTKRIPQQNTWSWLHFRLPKNSTNPFKKCMIN